MAAGETSPLAPNQALQASAGSIVLILLRVPLPRVLHGEVTGRVWQDEGGAIRTEVGIAAPVVGRIVRYEGALEPPA